VKRRPKPIKVGIGKCKNGILQKQSCNHRNVKIVAKRKGWEQESQTGIKRERNTCVRGERERKREREIAGMLVTERPERNSERENPISKAHAFLTSTRNQRSAF